MTAFTPADMPDQVNTIEKVNLWSSILLQHLNPELTVIEAAGSSDRAIVTQPWFITASAPPTWRVISRSSIQINSNWQRGGKLWTHAMELSGATIPSEFKTN